MKNFFTSFFATLTALIVFMVGGFLLGFLLLGALIALGQKKPVAVADDSYLVFDLSANILDTPAQAEGIEELIEALGGESQGRLQQRQVVRALRAAARIEPKVEPHPITSRSASSSPATSTGGMSLAMLATFHALLSVISWWLAGSYDTLPVMASFSRPPMRCSSPGVPGTAHGRAKVSTFRM